ncbi:aldo/keto reductase [Leuconostoc fallax]|uniref:aldo/keto reductase n=1 Tax=Leuconostoc fallax TaxID=1251 RepID=UPI0020904E28|nr:aldo/keto reductase [Leuconostoc fallax]MCO6184326.1 aldo/keto reductase [Leuconostoc fallax]
MQKIQIGQTDIQASAVALGVMRINDKSASEAQKIVQTAYGNGINFFDTADIYGAGRSSKIFGDALKTTGITRHDIYIQSKSGVILADGQIDGDGLKGPRYDFSKQHLIATVDTELRRLQTDYLDTFLLHRPDALMVLDDVAEAFQQLEQSGKVRYFGVSNMHPGQVTLLQSALSQKLQINQLQFGLKHTNMIDNELHVNVDSTHTLGDNSDILSYSRLNKMTIQAWSPLQYGYFGGVFVDNEQFPELNATLQALAIKYDVTKSSIAVAWILHHPAKIQVTIGTMNVERIAQMTDLDYDLTNQEWYDLYVAAGHDLP